MIFMIKTIQSQDSFEDLLENPEVDHEIIKLVDELYSEDQDDRDLSYTFESEPYIEKIQVTAYSMFSMKEFINKKTSAAKNALHSFTNSQLRIYHFLTGCKFILKEKK